MLTAFALLLQASQEERMVQFLLKAYMSVTNTCGVLELDEERDAWIMSLCKFCLPHWHSLASITAVNLMPTEIGLLTLTGKHMQSLKALFNVAHGLGSILGTGWHIVLETFEQLDYILHIASRRQRRIRNLDEMGVIKSISSTAGSLNEEDVKNGADFVQVTSLLDNLFAASKYLETAAITYFVSGLIELAVTSIAHASTTNPSTLPFTTNRTPSPSNDDEKNVLKAMTRHLSNLSNSLGITSPLSRQDARVAYVGEDFEWC